MRPHTVGTTNRLFGSYGKATGDAILFSEGTLRDSLTNLSVATHPATSSAATFVTPTFRTVLTMFVK